MKLHAVLFHFDDHDPSTLLGVTAAGVEAAMDIALADENTYEDDTSKWEQLEWREEGGMLTAHTNSSMGWYDIIGPIDLELP